MGRRSEGPANEIAKTTDALARAQTQFQHSPGVTRRQFLEIAAGTSVLASLPEYAQRKETAEEIPRRTLGRTEEQVSMVGLGGFHLGKPELQESAAIQIIRRGLDGGINFLDNCWDYNGGESEI